jgi:azurin
MIRHTMICSALVLAGLCAFADDVAAKTCEVEIAGDDMMKFDKTSIAIAGDCTEVKVTLKHVGKLPANAMGHNWVLTTTPDFQPVATAAAQAGAAAGYIPKDDRIIAHTKLIGGGESTSVTFPTSKLKKGGDYTFFCSFPGHWSQMKGKLTFG